MTTYGLTAAGLVVKTRQIIRDELDARLRGLFGQSIRLGARSLFGQISGVMSDVFGSLWDLMQAISASQDPDSATGAQLDALCALTGTTRKPAAESLVTATLCGDPATIIALGSRVKNGSAEQFRTLAEVAIAALPAWAAATAYVAGSVVGQGDRVTRSGRAYECIASGTSAATGPSSTSDDYTDGGGVHWRYLGEGSGAVDVAMKSLDVGPVVAASGDLTTIVTPISGWKSARNLLDAVLGRLVETDEDLRVRREAELATPGTSTALAIRADLLELVGVTSAHVFENNTDATDGDGLPPHTIEVLVQGGDNQAIRDLLLSHVAAGIDTHNSGGGAVTGNAVDDEGVAHVIKFTRPDEITIYVDITLKYDASKYPADGDAQIKAAIAQQPRTIGLDAVAARIGALAFTLGIGVLDVPRSGSLGGTLIKVTATPTTDATIVITSRQIATFDTSRVTVHSSAATP